MSNELSLELQKAIAAAHAGDKDQARDLADQVIQDDPENENALYLMSALVDSDEEREAYLSQILIVNPDHAGAQKYLAQADEVQVDEPAGEFEEEIVVSEVDLVDEYDHLDETIVVGAAAVAAAEEIPEISLEPERLVDEDVSETVPDWLMDEEEFVGEQIDGDEGELDLTEIEDVPDWLTDEPSIQAEEALSDEPAAEDSLADWSVDEDELVAAAAVEEAAQLPVEPEPEPVQVQAKTAMPKKPAAQKGPSDRALTIVLVILVLIALAIVIGIVILAITRPVLS